MSVYHNPGRILFFQPEAALGRATECYDLKTM